MKIYGYTIHRKKHTNTHTDGTAIAIKYNIKHKVFDDFISDTIAVEVETNTGNILIATLYQPPARQYIPIPDFNNIFGRNIPVYMVTDLNANHYTLGYRHINTKGRQLHQLIRNGMIKHIGPHFPTYIARNVTTTPDIILTNTRTYHNIHITQGPLTTSDHIPIICTLSTHPIQIPSPRRPCFKQANWDNFSPRNTAKIHRPHHTQQPYSRGD